MNRFSYFKPTLAQSWVIVALMFAGSLALGAISSVIKVFGGSGGLECESLSYLGSMLVPFIYIWLKAGAARGAEQEPKALTAGHFGKLGAAWTFVTAAIGVFAFGIVLEPTTAFIPMPEAIKKIFEEAFLNVPLWDGILSTCILAPLCEEFLCRGMMVRGMLSEGRSPRSAILWSALIFAVMHFNPWQSIPAFVIGAFFGWLYVKTGSLWLTVALHAFNNGLSTLMTRLMPDLGVDEGWMDILPTGKYILIYAICLVLVAQAIILIYRNYEKTISD